MLPVSYYLIVAAIIFSIGAYGVMTLRSGIMIMMCVELMLNAANINLIAFASHFSPVHRPVIVLCGTGSAAAEAAAGGIADGGGG